MGILEWFTQPVVDILTEMKETPQSVVIKTVNSSEEEFKLEPFAHKNRLFRPNNFSQFLGQKKVKKIVGDCISFVKERNGTLGHILISGEAGTGKTTLARIISHEIGANFIEKISSSLVSPFDLLFAIQKTYGGILFLDEVHGIERSLAETIYSVMEDFKHNGVEIKPFTLIGATTELGEMLATRRPFVDRFKLILELEDYTIEELAIMSQQYRLTVFPYDVTDYQIHHIIAQNCRKNPRTVIRLTEALIWMKDIKKVLYNFGIIKDGFTDKDLKILKYIALNEKGVGLQGMCSYLGTSWQNYVYNIEPFLIKNELIIRTPRGRKITDIGVAKILELEKSKLNWSII